MKFGTIVAAIKVKFDIQMQDLRNKFTLRLESFYGGHEGEQITAKEGGLGEWESENEVRQLDSAEKESIMSVRSGPEG